MKKTLALVLALTLMLGTGLVSAAAEASGFRFGLDVNTKIASSKDAEDANGVAQVDAVIVAVLLDDQGKIADVFVDSAQTKMPFTATGTLGDNFPAEPKTKLELGTEYGMSAVSKVGEWDQQIAAFEAYVIGKTADEVAGIAVDDATKPTGADLTAGCTMSIGDYIAGVVAAAQKAVPVTATATDKVGVGTVTTTGKSKDAMDGADGLAQAYSTYAAVLVGADGKILACLIDSTQGNVNFDATGKITSDLSARIATKQELGDAYGMRAASPIGKEWFEQANAFAAYVIGKTAAEVDGIALDESTKPTDADLVASVTISAGGLKASVLKGVANAK